MAARTAQAPVQISPRVVRINPRQKWRWRTAFWRMGPDTPDGFWMISPYPKVAVRIVYDETVEPIEVRAFDIRMEDARHAEQNDTEDAYLTSLTVVASIDPDELERLRAAVASGKAGGPKDGAPRRPR